MSAVSFCTALNRPPAAAAPVQHRRGAMQSGAPAAVAIKRKHLGFSVRAGGDNPASDHAFGIQPFALVHPKFPPMSGKWWRIKEDEEHVKLWFNVGDTAKEKLDVKIEDDVLLVSSKGSKVKGGGNANEEAELDARLLVPNGYDKNKVEAELTFGSLLLTIGKKPKPRDDDPTRVKPITISPIKDT